jgi:segregation and condensation protein B
VLLRPDEDSIAALAGHLVAVLFAAAGPLSPADAASVLDISAERLDEVLGLLEREPPTGLALQRHEDRLQLTTAPASAAIVERFLGAPPPVRLSRAALEALAVLAYRQPVTRGEIDAVRGVNSDSAVATLLARGLAAEVGRRETVGRPALLALTPECLQYLGIRSLNELPPLPQTDAQPATRDDDEPASEQPDAAASPDDNTAASPQNDDAASPVDDTAASDREDRPASHDAVEPAPRDDDEAASP